MTTLETYVDEINELLIDHPLVAAFGYVAERILASSAYIRVRVTLLDESSLFFTEYRELDINGEPHLVTYTYQWMSTDKALLRRWDNAEHYPDLPGFPHHIHDIDEKNVLPGEPMNLFKVLDYIADTLKKTTTSS